MDHSFVSSEPLISFLRRHEQNLEIFPGWPCSRVLNWIEEHRRSLFGCNSLDGEVIALTLANDVAGLLALLTIGAAGGVALPLPPETTEHERAKLMDRSGAARLLMPGSPPQLSGRGRGDPSDLANGILLATSGSTGAPKLARRSAESLVDEGRRYVEMLRLAPGARVLMAAPIVHAYALGWVVASLIGGWCIVPLRCTALGRVAEELVNGAAWAVLTPALARLLAQRPRVGPTGPARCRVMVGAGPVTRELEQLFLQNFSVGLARNYGSAETGALLAGFEGLPESCPGTPMPGVRIRIVDGHGRTVPPGFPGLLQVATSNGWHPMGDLVESDPDGRITILGRSTAALRRGDQWVAPLEVEASLSDYPGLRGLRATKVPGRNGRRERLAVDIWPNDPTGFSPPAFSSFVETRLQPAMRPDDIRVRATMELSAGGKLRATPRWRRGAAKDIADAARAYKRGELLFALNAAGVLDALDGVKGTDEIADELGLDTGALEMLLTIAARFGLVNTEDHDRGTSARDLVALEAELSGNLVKRDNIAHVMRSGLAQRPHSIGSAGLTDLYLRAMNGDAAALRVRFGLRALKLQPGSKLLEVTAGPGLYGLTAAGLGTTLAHTVWPVGPASGERNAFNLPIKSPLPEPRFDAIVLFNGLRWSPIPDRLAELKAILARDALLVIDDLFLEDNEASAEFALDWATHGGAAFTTVSELTAALTAIGFEVEVRPVPDSACARLVVARVSPV